MYANIRNRVGKFTRHENTTFLKELSVFMPWRLIPKLDNTLTQTTFRIIQVIILLRILYPLCKCRVSPGSWRSLASITH